MKPLILSLSANGKHTVNNGMHGKQWVYEESVVMVVINRMPLNRIQELDIGIPVCSQNYFTAESIIAIFVSQ